MKEPDFNKTFIAAIRKEACLYNCQVIEYSVKNAQDDAWQRLSDQFEKPVQSLKDRWKNLRAGLTRHIRNEYTAEKGGKKMRTKPYYLLKEMQFLIPFTKVDKPATIEYQLSDTHQEEEDEYMKSESYNNSNAVEIYFEDEPVEGSQNGASNLDVESNRRTVANNYHADYVIEEVAVEKLIPKEPVPGTHFQQTVEEIIPQREEITEKQQQPSRPSSSIPERNYEEAEMNFFRSLMPDILSMTPAQRRKMRMRFVGVIDEILSE